MKLCHQGHELDHSENENTEKTFCYAFYFKATFYFFFFFFWPELLGQLTAYLIL